MNAIMVGPYRYRLERFVIPGATLTTDFQYIIARETVCVLMVNPSTAGTELDDPTIRKVRGFARLHGWARFIVGNKFALRSTDVTNLRHAIDPVGPLNDTYLRDMMTEADKIICAWGPLAKLPPRLRGRWREVVALAAGKPLWCLGTSADGQPRHPLMLRYATPLVEWRPPC